MDADIAVIQSDVEKSTWVLINFLTNMQLRINTPENNIVRCSGSHRTNGSVQFTVQDYGQGIDERYLPKIFERYFKVPGMHERNGSGLGLAISREFIEAQEGRIWVQSEVGTGSLFGFSLKIANTGGELRAENRPGKATGVAKRRVGEKKLNAQGFFILRNYHIILVWSPKRNQKDFF